MAFAPSHNTNRPPHQGGNCDPFTRTPTTTEVLLLVHQGTWGRLLRQCHHQRHTPKIHLPPTTIIASQQVSDEMKRVAARSRNQKGRQLSTEQHKAETIYLPSSHRIAVEGYNGGDKRLNKLKQTDFPSFWCDFFFNWHSWNSHEPMSSLNLFSIWLMLSRNGVIEEVKKTPSKRFIFRCGKSKYMVYLNEPTRTMMDE
jgi:hypothetical protein